MQISQLCVEWYSSDTHPRQCLCHVYVSQVFLSVSTMYSLFAKLVPEIFFSKIFLRYPLHWIDWIWKHKIYDFVKKIQSHSLSKYYIICKYSWHVYRGLFFESQVQCTFPLIKLDYWRNILIRFFSILCLFTKLR